MLPYWVIFLLAAYPAAKSARHRRGAALRGGPAAFAGPWSLVVLGLTLAIGLRHQVGGDWYNYFSYLEESRGLTISDIWQREDPAYWLLNLLSLEAGWGIVGVNLMSGFVFSAGLVLFCRSCPRPWLALAVAIPYMVIVVAMGYTRQSVALGLAMVGFVALERKRYVRFLLWTVLAATFHKSAVLLIPIAALTATRNKLAVAGIALITAAAAYNVLLAEYAERLLINYTDEVMTSSGALIRLAMNAVPAAIFLRHRGFFREELADYKLWYLLSCIAVGMFVLYFFVPASSAFDRMGLYLIPLQLVVFSRLPDIRSRSRAITRKKVLTVVGYYALVLFVWLNFAVHARYWVPYTMSFDSGLPPGYASEITWYR